MKTFIRGVRGGIPIGMGYLPVSFSFGIMAVSCGLEWWQALLISMTTLTSAGQLAALGVMVYPGQYIEMLVSQLTINLRYSFMSMSLSQKTTPEFRGVRRWLLGFFMTDEIFAVASAEQQVSTKFFMGLAVMPYIGWAAGTLLGSVLGNILPPLVMNALCLAIYGMFLAIIAPVARRSVAVLSVVGVAIALHVAFYYIPGLNTISSGLSISICAIVAAVFGAVVFPVEDREEAAE